MKHKERKIARRYDTPYRCRLFTDKVYSGVAEDSDALKKEVFDTPKKFYPEKSEYNIYYGELHGHSCLSDGEPDADAYYKNIRDNAKLDFGVLTDHDHGGVGKAELYGEKWEEVKAFAKKYYEPGKFTTILGYERDSYPWYNNAVVYFDSHDADMLPADNMGDISKEELLDVLSRKDAIFVPHDTYTLDSGADFLGMDKECFTSLIEIYSRGDSAEYFGNPYNECYPQVEGGFWQDALKRGAKMGVIAASDDHSCKNGLIRKEFQGLKSYPGITGVLAKENTLEAIFEALKERRCYGFIGPEKIGIDFRINGHYMGEEFETKGDREIYFRIETETPVKMVTLVKNCRDYMRFSCKEQFIYDYKKEKDTDVYYMRVELSDGRCAWTSPVWVSE